MGVVVRFLLAALCGFCLASSITVNRDPLNNVGYTLYRQEVEYYEDTLTMDPQYEMMSRSTVVRPNEIVEEIQPGLSTNPSNVQRAERVFGQNGWNRLTVVAAPEYSYTSLLKAIGKFPAFCGDYFDDREQSADYFCKKSILILFAHFAYDSGMRPYSVDMPRFKQGLHKVREFNEASTNTTEGCEFGTWVSAKWPCHAGAGYFGRGGVQMTHNWRYGAFSEAMFDGNSTVLLATPNIAADTWLNLASAIWIFITPVFPAPSMLHATDRSWVPTDEERAAGIRYGFGVILNIYKGSKLCGPNAVDPTEEQERGNLWREIVAEFQLYLEGEEGSCKNQTPFDDPEMRLKTSLPYMHWDKNHETFNDRPMGLSFECILVPHVTAYSALNKREYKRCVENVYGTFNPWPPVRIVDMCTPEPPSTTDSVYGECPPIPGWIHYNRGYTYLLLGDGITFNCKCYITIRCPNKWEVPTNEYFFDEVPCNRPPPPGIADTCSASTTTTTTPTTTTTTTVRCRLPQRFRHFIPGVTDPESMEGYMYDCNCYLAKNDPGPWDTPPSYWFWTKVDCEQF